MGKSVSSNVGLLVLRIGIGTMFIYHGVPKLMGGPEAWAGLGQVMGMFGINFAPAFWGFMAAFSEAVGGLLIIIGLFLRPACLLLLVTMIVAASMHISKGDGLGGAAHAIESGILFLSLFIIGPGGLNIQKLIFRPKSKNKVKAESNN